MYDLWLTKGCTQPFKIQESSNIDQSLLSPSVISQISSKHPGFLGLYLAKSTARVLLDVLKKNKARGIIVPYEYRNPVISIENALIIAEESILNRSNIKHPEYTLNKTQMLREHAMWWTFGANAQELIDRDIVPGAIFANIDKLDGHVWKPEDMEFVLENDS